MALLDLLQHYYSALSDQSVKPQVVPGSVYASLPEQLPDTPESFEKVLSDTRQLIMPALTHWQHPGFMHSFHPTAVSRHRRVRSYHPGSYQRHDGDTSPRCYRTGTADDGMASRSVRIALPLAGCVTRHGLHRYADRCHCSQRKKTTHR